MIDFFLKCLMLPQGTPLPVLAALPTCGLGPPVFRAPRASAAVGDGTWDLVAIERTVRPVERGLIMIDRTSIRRSDEHVTAVSYPAGL